MQDHLGRDESGGQGKGDIAKEREAQIEPGFSRWRRERS